MGGFSTVGGASAADVWNYPTRDLTRVKYPFWSAIIPQTQNGLSIAAFSSLTVTIQPPTGETWLVYLDLMLATTTSGGYVEYQQVAGTSTYIHTRFVTGGTYGDYVPHLSLTKILTNANYAQILYYNASAGSTVAYYGYSGFKLSQPLWSPKRLVGGEGVVWKRATQYPIPTTPDLTPLAKYIYDVYDSSVGDYRQAIILEEDIPLAVDEKGFPVERLTAYVFVDDFIKNLTAFKADPVKTGYKKYFDKWASGGIKI